MAREYDPVRGQWYQSLEDDETFQVLSVDEDAELIEIQYADGDIEEIDYDTWTEMDLEKAEEPDGWSGSEDEDEDGEEEDEDDDDDEWEEDEDLIDDEEDGDEDEEAADEDAAAGRAWQDLLHSKVEEELARHTRREQRRAALIENRIRVQSAAVEMLSDYFEQVSRELGVVVEMADQDSTMSYAVSVKGSNDWMERVKIEAGDTRGAWRVVLSSGRIIKKLPELEEYLRDDLTKLLATQLAPWHAELLRQERVVEEARERERKLAMEAERKAAEARQRERQLDREARMIARSQGSPDKK